MIFENLSAAHKDVLLFLEEFSIIKRNETSNNNSDNGDVNTIA